jgi:hypothetical protein
MNDEKKTLLLESLRYMLLVAIQVFLEDGLRSALLVALRKVEDTLGYEKHTYPARKGQRYAAYKRIANENN